MWLLIIAILFIIFLFVMAAIGFKRQSEEKIKKEEEMDKGIKKYNALLCEEYKHVCGLPLAENSECKLYLCPDKVVVESSGNMFKLERYRILDVSTKDSKEIQNSISGAVGGAMLFGPLGAFALGSSTNVSRYLVFIYKNKEGEPTCISFSMEITTNKLRNTEKFIRAFKPNTENKKEIEI